MAALRGDIGKFQFNAAGGTTAIVASTRNWSVSISKDVIETTKQGDNSKTNTGGLISAEGSCELLYDPAESGTGYTTFIDDILTTGDDGTATFEFFPNKDTAGKTISFAGIVTGAEYGATLGEVEVINISFVANGDIAVTV